MRFEESDIIDFNVMHKPPTFVTTVRTDSGNSVVVTSGNDFPGVVVQWPDEIAEERAEDFWSLGLLHLCEVELVKLSGDARSEAMAKANALERHDPRALASNVASIIREVTSAHPGVAKTTFKLATDEMTQYRTLLIIRATAPYVGSDDVDIRNSGVIAA